MRVIAGALKGRRLEVPRGRTTRPTADQVRIALMDTLAPRLAGARVLDLFAGAGGVGLEALSRGAAHATFVERDARAVAALETNVRTLGVEDRARVLRLDAARALVRLPPRARGSTSCSSTRRTRPGSRRRPSRASGGAPSWYRAASWWPST